MEKTIVISSDSCQNIDTEWGRLEWFANSEIGNSSELTVGRCIIKPGEKNPMHHHPNCSEVLVVQKGEIRHAADGDSFAMKEGDVITIPAGVVHNAENTGNDDAVLMIAFSSADRKTIGE